MNKEAIARGCTKPIIFRAEEPEDILGEIIEMQLLSANKNINGYIYKEGTKRQAILNHIDKNIVASVTATPVEDSHIYMNNFYTIKQNDVFGKAVGYNEVKNTLDVKIVSIEPIRNIRLDDYCLAARIIGEFESNGEILDVQKIIAFDLIHKDKLTVI